MHCSILFLCYLHKNFPWFSFRVYYSRHLTGPFSFLVIYFSFLSTPPYSTHFYLYLEISYNTESIALLWSGFEIKRKRVFWTSLLSYFGMARKTMKTMYVWKLSSSLSMLISANVQFQLGYKYAEAIVNSTYWRNIVLKLIQSKKTYTVETVCNRSL